MAEINIANLNRAQRRKLKIKQSMGHKIYPFQELGIKKYKRIVRKGVKEAKKNNPTVSKKLLRVPNKSIAVMKEHLYEERAIEKKVAEAERL